MKLWTVRSKCEKKKKKKKASAIKRIQKSWCGSAVYNPLITSRGFPLLSNGQR